MHFHSLGWHCNTTLCSLDLGRSFFPDWDGAHELSVSLTRCICQNIVPSHASVCVDTLINDKWIPHKPQELAVRSTWKTTHRWVSVQWMSTAGVFTLPSSYGGCLTDVPISLPCLRQTEGVYSPFEPRSLVRRRRRGYARRVDPFRIICILA